MNYEEWAQTVPETLRRDPLWTVTTYRFALFLADLCWQDVTKLERERRTAGLCDQLYRAVGSVGANLAEGYSRSTGKERAHFYEYSLGSARESRHWYHQGRHVLGEDVLQHRFGLLDQIIRLLVTMVPQQRNCGTIRESKIDYQVGPANTEPGSSMQAEFPSDLLYNVPIPDL
jgi:four helix bundle protein